MRKKFFTTYLILSFIFLALTLVYVMEASAKIEEKPHTLPLSSSGYDRGHSLAFSSDGKHLAVGGISGIYLIDYQKLSKLDYIETNSWVRSLAFIPNTHTLVAGLFDRTVKFWDVSNLELLQTLNGHQGWVRSISISGDGSLIASASDDNTLRIWRVNDGTPVLVVDKNTTGVRAVALSPDGRLVAGALGDHTVRVWNVPDGELVHTLVGHTDWVRCLAFSPDGSLLASGSFDKTIRLWDLTDDKEVRVLNGHASSVLSIAFSPDGLTLASGSVDETIRLWNVDSGASFRVLEGHSNFVYAVAFAPDGLSLASGAGDNAVRIWDLDAIAGNKSSSVIDTQTNQSVSSDCRACHHRRDTIEPARVIEFSCQGCHAGGAGLSWCIAFPGAGISTNPPIAYYEDQEVSGVPLNGREVAVVIASPSNGETLYVMGDYMAPEVISGRVFYADQESITKVELQLDIMSGDQRTESIVTNPSDTGQFSFNVAINPESPLPQIPSVGGCRVCHNYARTESGLPNQDVRIIVTATTPEGAQASDERWLRVDSSDQADIPVQVIDNLTGEPIPGLSIEAFTVLYEWRSRTVNAASDTDGIIQLNLESLSQSPTTYTISIPSQVINGLHYSSNETAQVMLEPGKTSYPTVKLRANGQAGRLTGNLIGDDLPTDLEGTIFWAVQSPVGPVYQAALGSDNTFTFEDLPIDEYLLFADLVALGSKGVYTPNQRVNLINSPQTSISIPLTKSHQIAGKVYSDDGSPLPFAWVTKGEDVGTVPINPISSMYLIQNLATDVTYLTVSAPGYYTQSKPIDLGVITLDFQLVPQPETRHLTWGDGVVTLPPETSATVSDLDIEFEYGWLWGSGGGAEALRIHMPGLEVSILNGDFALESPVVGTTWFYLYDGKAQLMFSDSPSAITVNTGEMIALAKDNRPIPMEEAVVAGFHPRLDEVPIAEVIKPSLKAGFENWLEKAIISTAQTITLFTYILSLAILIGIPLYALFRKKRIGKEIIRFLKKHLAK